MAVAVIFPKLDEAMTSGKIVRWLKNEGDRVEKGEITATAILVPPLFFYRCLIYLPIISRAAALIFSGLTRMYCSCPGLKDIGESSEATRLIGASR